MTRRHRQRGVNLVAALFVLIVLAGLAAFIVTLAGVQHQTSALAAQSARAWYAAQGGLELAAYQSLDNQQCQTPSETIEGLEVSTSCESSSHQEGGTEVLIFELTATAEGGSTEAGDRVRRQVRTTVIEELD